MKLNPSGRLALWIGGGGFVGLAVGALITNPGRSLELAPGWAILLALYVGIVVALTRDKAAAAEPAAEAKPARPVPIPVARAVQTTPPRPGDLLVAFELPDVPAGFPAVMGRGEPLNVRVSVKQRAQPADAAGLRSGLSAGTFVPAEGAAVQLTATMAGESLTGDGLTGTAGAVEFTLEPEGTGELRLHADAKAGASSGEGHGAVSIVNYDEEIERLFSEFRAFAISVLGAEARADTARELADKLRVRAKPDAARALLELARVYELVAYGERRADRRLYLAVMEQLLVLEHADMPEAQGALPREA